MVFKCTRGADWGHYLGIIAFADANTVRLCDSRKTQQKYDFLYILLFVCLSFFSMQKHNDINNAYTCNSPTNWLHLQVNWTLSWWMNLNPRCISPCRFPTEPPFSRRTPLPCSGFHRPAPRPFSVQRLVSQKTHGQKACEKKEPCDGFISYLLEVCIYIFSIKMFRCW